MPSTSKLFKPLRSVKLAVALVALIAAGAAAASLVPQGLSSEAYHKAFPLIAGGLLALGLDHYFSSLLFLATVALFIVNLGSCTAYRLVSQFKKKGGKRRFGPDILHAGLLVLCLGAVLSAAGRTQVKASLSRGDEVALPGGQFLKLQDIELRRYPDGSPQSYISTVELRTGGASRLARISVNHPLKVGKISIYQTDYGRAASAILDSPSGGALRVYGGETKSLADGGKLLFMAVTGAGAEERGLFALTAEGRKDEVLRAGAGEEVAGFKVRAFEEGEVSGLKIASDPGYPFALSGFLIIAIGLCLTYIQKIRDMHS
jgi:cytochrome c biogenesis protein ResB